MFTSSTPFIVIRERARLALDRLQERMNRGEIPSRAHLLAEITDQVSRFGLSIDQPTMEVPLMSRDELLIRELVETPLEQLYQDLEVADRQLTSLRETTRRGFNLSQAERAGLRENLLALTNEIDALRLWISDSDPTFIWAGDNLNDRSKLDPASTIFHDPEEGVAILQPTDSLSLSDRIVQATIDKQVSRGGLPGNNSEVRQPGREAFTGERPEPRPILFAESKPRRDTLASLWDGNPDTWFEWERVYVPVPQPTLKAGNALIYDPAGRPNRKISRLANWNCFIRYPGETQVDAGARRKGYPLAYFTPEDRIDLRLGINITLDQPRSVSWVRLTPLIYAGLYPEVEQIAVSTDGTKWENILTTPTVLHPRMNRGLDFSDEGVPASNFEGIAVWALPARAIRHLRIILKQSGIYEAPLGIAHRFFMTRKRRKKVKGNILVVGSHAGTLSDPQELDFSEDETETKGSITRGYDLFQGSRQVIAIRDLLLEQRTYAETGQLIAKPFSLERPIRAVSLLTQETIPDEWAPRRSDGEDWISYEVSHDGQTWLDIIPQIATLDSSVVRLPQPTTTLHFRATFTRPAEESTATPILRSYALKCLPQ